MGAVTSVIAAERTKEKECVPFSSLSSPSLAPLLSSSELLSLRRCSRPVPLSAWDCGPSPGKATPDCRGDSLGGESSPLPEMSRSASTLMSQMTRQHECTSIEKS